MKRRLQLVLYLLQYIYPLRLTQPSIILKGALVNARLHSETFFVITDNAPTFAPSLISTGATSTEFEPILTSFPSTVFDFSFVSGL